MQAWEIQREKNKERKKIVLMLSKVKDKRRKKKEKLACEWSPTKHHFLLVNITVQTNKSGTAQLNFQGSSSQTFRHFSFRVFSNYKKKKKIQGFSICLSLSKLLFSITIFF